MNILFLISEFLVFVCGIQPPSDNNQNGKNEGDSKKKKNKQKNNKNSDNNSGKET